MKPDAWTDALRKGFLQGLSLVLNLLTMMQGMDAIARQVGQHMEFEPEWESAFNLHIKLATVITLALEWCGTDRVVLVKAYRAALRQLHNNQPPDEPAVLQGSKLSLKLSSRETPALSTDCHLFSTCFRAGRSLRLVRVLRRVPSARVHSPAPQQVLGRPSPAPAQVRLELRQSRVSDGQAVARTDHR